MADDKHVPTEEELQKKAEEIEAKKKESQEETEEETTEEETQEETVEEEASDEEDKETTKTEPDYYKERYKESTKQAQVLNSRLTHVTDAFDKAKDTPAPTEEEMQAKYPEWDGMSDIEKKMATENELSSRRFAALEGATNDIRDAKKWEDSVTKFVKDPVTLNTYPKLEGKLTDFEIYAEHPSRRGADFDTLVKAFLYDETGTKPAPKKGAMFDTGTGGPTDKGKPAEGKLTIEQGRALRKSNYNKWVEYVQAGKIESGV